MTSCMLDIETLGTKPGCVVLSIGAVAFDPETFEVRSEFLSRISIGSSIIAGLTIEPGTLAWWQTQTREAQTELLGFTDIRDAAAEFCDWFAQSGCDGEIWAQGADFDFPILKSALAAGGFDSPWRFYNQRDTRTAYSICRFDRKSVDRNSVEHSAVADAYYQILCLKAAFARISYVETTDAVA